VDHSNCSHAIAAKKRQLNKGAHILEKKLGDVTSLNVTMIQADVQMGDTYTYNCIPHIASCGFDIKISPHDDPSSICTMLDAWCQECSSDAENG